MIKSIPAVSIGTTAVSVDLLTQAPNLSSYGEVKVVNESPNPIQVEVGTDSQWLPAWWADVYCLKGARRITLVPTILESVTPPAMPTSHALLEVGERPGEIPGVYPCPDSRVTRDTDLRLLGTVQASPNSSNHSDFTLDGGVYGVMIDPNAPANLTNVTVTDLTNSRTLFNGSPPTTYPTVLLISNATVRVAVTAGLGGTSAGVTVYETLAPLVVSFGPGLGQQLGAASLSVVLASDNLPQLQNSRTYVDFNLQGGAPPGAEAAVTMTIHKGLNAPSTGTSYTVSAGKTLRITGARILVSHTAANVAVFRIRQTTTLTGNELYRLTGQFNTAGGTVIFPDDFRDGAMEFPSGTVLQFSLGATVAAGAVEVSIVGYEY